MLAQGVKVKELAVFDTGRYVIATPDYGSVFESLAEAVDNGHQYFPDYWELLSIEVAQDGCCGGITRVLADTYFERDSGSIFGWRMTHVEATFATNPTLFLTFEIEADPNGLIQLGFGVEMDHAGSYLDVRKGGDRQKLLYLQAFLLDRPVRQHDLENVEIERSALEQIARQCDVVLAAGAVLGDDSSDEFIA